MTSTQLRSVCSIRNELRRSAILTDPPHQLPFLQNCINSAPSTKKMSCGNTPTRRIIILKRSSQNNSATKPLPLASPKDICDSPKGRRIVLMKTRLC